MKTVTYDDTLYQLVPKEPTQDMERNGKRAIQDLYAGDGGWCGDSAAKEQLTITWRSMLSAAPTPPAQPEAVRVPLTEDRLRELWEDATNYWQNNLSERNPMLRFARAIEAAHGITAAAPKEQS